MAIHLYIGVFIAKTGQGTHSSKLVVICIVLLLFVLFYVLFVCKYVLYYYHRVWTQLQLTNISHQSQTSLLKKYRPFLLPHLTHNEMVHVLPLHFFLAHPFTTEAEASSFISQHLTVKFSYALSTMCPLVSPRFILTHAAKSSVNAAIIFSTPTFWEWVGWYRSGLHAFLRDVWTSFRPCLSRHP